MSKRKNKPKRKINKFKAYIYSVSALLAWLSITTLLIIKKYDILPFKYMLLAMVGLLLIPAGLIFVMLKKKMKKIIKTISSAFSVLIILFLIVLLFYLHKTFKFLGNLQDDGYTIRNYSVIVMNNNTYDDIEQLSDKNISYYISNKEDKEEVLNKLNEKVISTTEETEDYGELVKKLYSNRTDAILMEESYTGVLEESYPNFKTETKVLYTIEIKTKTETIVKEVNVNKDTFNIYITGIDTYGSISSVSRSDVNIIATVNPKTHQVLLTTIPRDYYVQLDGTEGSYKDKLTHAGIYGVEKSIKTLENLLSIDINYYVKVNFSSLERIVDSLGGVDVYSEYTFTGCEGTNFVRGYNRVNGTQALEFARTRKTVVGGDRTRGINQQALIQAILKKSTSKEIITKYTNLLSSLEGSFQTNMSTDKMTDIIKKQIDEMSSWNVTSISLDGQGSSELTYSYPSQELYVMIPDEETVENAKTKIREVENGAVLESTYNADDSYVNNPTQTTPPVVPDTTPTPTPEPTPTPTPTPEPTPTPTETPTPAPTETPTPAPEPTPEPELPQELKPIEEPTTSTEIPPTDTPTDNPTSNETNEDS